MIIHHHQQEWHTTDKAEILQNDAILAYRGNDSHVRFTASFETKSDDSTRQLDVALIAIDCQDLVEHMQPLKSHNFPIKFTKDFKDPIFVPYGYHHYELVSTFFFSVESKNVPGSSALYIRIFDNTLEADFYEDHANDPNARGQAVKVIRVKTNTTFNANYVPPYASYFIPMFDAVVTGGSFDISMSYFVGQKFYQFTDYAKNMGTRCVLNSSKPCNFDFSERNETCVVAYNPPSFDGTNAVLLTTEIHTGERKEYYVHRKLCYSSWSFLILFIVVIFGTCGYLLHHYRKNHTYSGRGYQPVLKDSPSYSDCTVTVTG